MSDLKRILDSLGIGYGVYDENDCLLDYNQGSEPEGVDNIDNITDLEMRRKMNEYTEWGCTLNSYLADFEEKIKVLEDMSAKIYERGLSSGEKKLRLTEKKALAKTDNEYIELQDRISLYKRVVNFIEKSLEKTNRRFSNLSRQIEIRKQEIGKFLNNLNQEMVFKENNHSVAPFTPKNRARRV